MIYLRISIPDSYIYSTIFMLQAEMQELSGSFNHVLGIKPTGWTHEKGKQYSIS